MEEPFMRKVKKARTVRVSAGVLFGTLLCFFIFALSFPACIVDAAASDEFSDNARATNVIKGKKVRVGYIYSPNFSEGTGDSEIKSGLAYDYLQHISYYTNWNYEYVYGGWAELIRMLYDGEIDVMAGVSKNPERLDKLLFPEYAMGSENYYIYTGDGNPLGIQGIKGISGCTVSVNKDSIMEGILREWNANGKRGINIKVYSGSEERYSDFYSGKVDATVDTDNAVPANRRLIPVTKIGQSEYFLAVTKNKPELLEELNSALDKINSSNPYFLRKLTDTYFSELSVSTSLQADEIEWLNNHPNIVVGYLNDYLPLCDMDENGNPTGSMMDIIDEMLTDLKLKDKVNMSFVAYNSYESMLSDLQTGVVDVAFPVNNDVALAERSNIFLSDEVFATPMYMVYKGDFADVKKNRIAAKRGTSIADMYIKRFIPGAEVVYFDKIPDMLDAVLDGSVDGAVLNAFRKDAYLHKVSYSGLNSVLLKVRARRCFAVKRGNRELLSVLNRGVTVVPQEIVLTSVNSYASRMDEFTLKDYLLQNIASVMLISGIVIAVVSVLTAYSFIIRRTRKKLDYIAHHDSLTGLFNRLSFNEDLKKWDKKLSKGNVVVAVMDLNDLKRINDGLGHEAGDEIIVGAAECMEKILSPFGRIYRIGGDEFTAILDKGTDDWPGILRRLKERFDGWSGKYVNKLAVAIGTAKSSDGPFENIHEMINHADQEMYRNKDEYYRVNGIDRRR